MDFSTVGGPIQGAKPRGWNLGAAYNFQLFNRDGTFAVAYRGTDESLGLELPKERLLLSLGVGVYEDTTLSFERAHDKDYGSTKTGAATGITGTGNDADTVTVQLAVEF